jgi:hypothetical protein
MQDSKKSLSAHRSMTCKAISFPFVSRISDAASRSAAQRPTHRKNRWAPKPFQLFASLPPEQEISAPRRRLRNFPAAPHLSRLCHDGSLVFTSIKATSFGDAGTMMRWRRREIKTPSHFENGDLRYVFVGLVAEDVGQKNNILKNLRCGGFILNTGHGRLLSISGLWIRQKHKRRSIGEPMSAFAQSKAALPSPGEMSNCHARRICRKSLNITEVFSSIPIVPPDYKSPAAQSSGTRRGEAANYLLSPAKRPPAKRIACATSAIGLRMFMLAFLISE